MKNLKILPVIVMLFVSPFILTSLSPEVSCLPSIIGWVDLGVVDVRLYVVALDGVGGSGAVPFNVSTVVDGALKAASLPHASFWWSRYIGGDLLYYRLNFSVDSSVVRDWNNYKTIVEEGSNAIILNAHGQIIPVPAGYDDESWVDKIAEAMLHRNVTWVHTAWYPFSRYYTEADGKEHEWEPAGFQQLMKHIGKQNAMCSPPGPELEHIRINTQVEDSFGMAWGCSYFFTAHWGRPLNGSEFKELLVLPIWGTPDGYLTGGIIKFAKTYNSLRDFGFYIHIGTNETFNVDDEPTGGDYWRGYVGAASAIWVNALRLRGEKAILEAEQAMMRAKAEGRTKGLEKSIQLLEQAKTEFYEKHWYDCAIESALASQEAAEGATEHPQPTFLEKYGLQIMATVIVCIAIIVTNIWQKRNTKNEGATHVKKAL